MTNESTKTEMVKINYNGTEISVPKSLAEKIEDELLRQWEEETDEIRQSFFNSLKSELPNHIPNERDVISGYTLYFSFDSKGIEEAGIIKSEKFKVLQKVRRTKEELEREKKEAKSKK